MSSATRSPPGGAPESLAFGGGAIWVGQRNGTVLRIDPGTGRATSLRPGGDPSDVKFGEGSVWVYNYRRSVTRIDPSNGVADDFVDTGRDIGDFAVGEGGVWVTHPKEGTVSFVNAATQKVSPPARVGTDLGSIAAGGGEVWVSRRGEKRITYIDPPTRKIAGTVALGKTIGDLKVVDQVLYVGTRNDVSRVDTVSGVAGKPYPDPTGASTFTVGAGSLWRTFPLDGTIDRSDLVSGKRTGDPIELPIRPDGVIFGLGKVWVLDRQARKIVSIEP